MINEGGFPVGDLSVLNTETIVKTPYRCKCAFHVANTLTAEELGSKLSQSGRKTLLCGALTCSKTSSLRSR